MADGVKSWFNHSVKLKQASGPLRMCDPPVMDSTPVGSRGRSRG